MQKIFQLESFMTRNIVIPNPERFKKIKKAISKGGPEHLHILSDFDRTLTKAFVDGKSVPSLISILREENYLTPDYSQKAKELYAKYHPIEIDPNISLKEKKKAMREWWMAHFDLLIRSGLNKRDLKKVVESDRIKLKEGCQEFLDFLQKHNIPLVIISSSGLGKEAIAMYLEKKGRLYKNIYIISNSYEWDEAGNAIAVKQPIIHGMNKDMTIIQNFPVFEIIKERKNVLLMGDNLADVEMVKGFHYDNLLKIGFLNEKVKENLEQYKNKYDFLILNDASMEPVNSLLKEIITRKIFI